VGSWVKNMACRFPKIDDVLTFEDAGDGSSGMNAFRYI
jgi:hypothetical protein